jgi:hypothetical protein
MKLPWPWIDGGFPFAFGQGIFCERFGIRTSASVQMNPARSRV